jgi:NADH:ubiquinone oxidoreductase subunit B-like Fe-S oxidoreductase
MPEPKLVIAMGACAISGGVFAECAEVDRSFLKTFKPALYVPGCPTHPLVFIAAVMDFLGIDAR